MLYIITRSPYQRFREKLVHRTLKIRVDGDPHESKLRLLAIYRFNKKKSGKKGQLYPSTPAPSPKRCLALLQKLKVKSFERPKLIHYALFSMHTISQIIFSHNSFNYPSLSSIKCQSKAFLSK